MSQELKNPKQLIQTTFSTEQIQSFHIVTSVISTVLAAATIARWFQRQYYCTKKTTGHALLQGGATGEDERLYSSTN